MGSIIIGFGTIVSFGGCAISAQWGYNPNVQRLYCLGQTTPEFNILKPTESLSITVYGDVSGNTYDMALSTTCAMASVISAGVSPAACGGSVDGVSGDWFVNSYSYSKGDPQMPGQESWGMTRWVAAGDVDEPTYVLRMSAEGESTVGASTGVTFLGTTTQGSTGSVSAGALGQGDIKEYGAVGSVGGSAGGAGEIASGSASANYTPLWVS